ncbi:uncharacterized protein C8orf88 homolog isoform X2 [Dendrobates tinctorius]
MEVGRLRHKALQPARPVSRTIPDSGALLNLEAKFTNHCKDDIKEHCNLWPSTGNLHDIDKDRGSDKPTEEPAVNTTEGCELLLSNNLEVGRLRRKPLQPARPIRRTIPDSGAMLNSQAKVTDHCKDDIKEHCNLCHSTGNLHDIFKDRGSDKPTEEPAVNTPKDRITYSRDLLMQISYLSVCKKKPKHLPDLSIIHQYPVSSLHRATDPLHAGSLDDTHPSMRLQHAVYHP